MRGRVRLAPQSPHFNISDISSSGIFTLSLVLSLTQRQYRQLANIASPQLSCAVAARDVFAPKAPHALGAILSSVHRRSIAAWLTPIRQYCLRYDRSSGRCTVQQRHQLSSTIARRFWPVRHRVLQLVTVSVVSCRQHGCPQAIQTRRHVARLLAVFKG